MKFEKITPFIWEIPRVGAMRVPGRIYAAENMLSALDSDKVTSQIQNVATLPGICGYSFAMPDAHWGYGFPIGGVAAMRLEDGVVSPGGVGYDISCGVRLLSTGVEYKSIKNRIPALMDAVFSAVPCGLGQGGKLRLDDSEMCRVFEKGAGWALERGFGCSEDLLYCEDGGCCAAADPSAVSSRAIERGRDQLGTLGSGNHFVEIGEVVEVFDKNAADTFGLHKGYVTVLIHSGSRGCGYQICDEFAKQMIPAASKYGIPLADRQLACVPLSSAEGRRYMGAMFAAANYAKANRHIIASRVRDAFVHTLGISPRDAAMSLVYDVSHNIAKVEEHVFEGRTSKFCVHRKGATRAMPAGSRDVPEKYQNVGQPVFVPGSMGTDSYVLTGTDKAAAETFSSICHGAGRAMSRTQSAKNVNPKDLMKRLALQGIEVRAWSVRGLAEEAPSAYKDIAGVVEVCVGAGLAAKVARIRPVGVLKG